MTTPSISLISHNTAVDLSHLTQPHRRSFSHLASASLSSPPPHSHISISSSKKVWSLVRRFDQPQKYKPFVSRCVVQGNLEIGSLREVDVKSGLPATTSTERLELLDDDEHILSVRIVDGDHRLRFHSLLVFVVVFGIGSRQLEGVEQPAAEAPIKTMRRIKSSPLSKNKWLLK
ncbi:hypothetical protein LguiB_005654 [Lonicera macranthoides]